MAYIKKEFVERLREEAAIEKVVQACGVELKKKGANYTGLSPWTKEKTGSFTVSPAKGIWKDFSSGKGGADAISFVMQLEGMSDDRFPEAVKRVAQICNLEVEYSSEKASKAQTERLKKLAELRPILKASLAQYQKAFLALADDHPAKLEVKKRGYTPEDVKYWGIGYAPGKQFLFEMLREKGLTKEAKELGLIGEQADKLWDRVVYPIYDKNNLLIGLASRDISGSKKAAKWMNPPENSLYHKEKVWYALEKAGSPISKMGEAWIVEGYNDVIAWHKNELENTIASCGTAITAKQIQLLKRYTSKVVLALDPDPAGTKATLKHIPAFLTEGFSVQIQPLECDPDDFSRERAKEIKAHGLTACLANLYLRIDGFKFLLDETLKEADDITKATKAKELCSMIGQIEDEPKQLIYSEWLAKESGIKLNNIARWVKQSQKVEAAPKATEEISKYIWPEELKGMEEKLIPTVEKYGLCMANNRIWYRKGYDFPYFFKGMSNFSIEIIQHMQDEKTPMKLVRIKNVRNDERVFDVPSDNINAPQAFDNAMTAQGNFLFEGGRNELNLLRAMLFDQMGVGSKIDIMGWQVEGFWCWNNKIVVPGDAVLPISDYGVVHFGKTCYYIPSANKIYRNNNLKFQGQKKLKLQEHGQLSFEKYTGMMVKVHRGHAITAILFTVASIFQDVVVEKLGNFPMMFLYGPASSGKDQLIECCQSFFGSPQPAINLEGGVSTAKAQVRELAQFMNMISHLSEYKSGDAKLNGILKGFWDRRGYKRGNLDSHVGTDEIPVLSSVIMTGNHYPDDDALITRLLTEEMTKTDFNRKEIENYNALRDMTKEGLTHFVVQLLESRADIEAKFLDAHRKAVDSLKSELNLIDLPSRMLTNTAVLTAFYHLLKDTVHFPFALADFTTHIRQSMDRQLRKLKSASVTMKWWDCFLVAIRTKNDGLKHGREFELKDGKLYFNFTHSYNRVVAQWWAQYHETMPSKGKITEVIKTDATFVKEKGSHRLGLTKTSVWVVDVSQMAMKEDLVSAIEWQEMDSSGQYRTETPATPGNFDDNQPKEDDELPF